MFIISGMFDLDFVLVDVKKVFEVFGVWLDVKKVFVFLVDSKLGSIEEDVLKFVMVLEEFWVKVILVGIGSKVN